MTSGSKAGKDGSTHEEEDSEDLAKEAWTQILNLPVNVKRHLLKR